MENQRKNKGLLLVKAKGPGGRDIDCGEDQGIVTVKLRGRWSVWGRMDTVALKVGRRGVVGLIGVRRHQSAGV